MQVAATEVTDQTQTIFKRPLLDFCISSNPPSPLFGGFLLALSMFLDAIRLLDLERWLRPLPSSIARHDRRAQSLLSELEMLPELGRETRRVGSGEEVLETVLEGIEGGKKLVSKRFDDGGERLVGVSERSRARRDEFKKVWKNLGDRPVEETSIREGVSEADSSVS